MSRIGVVGSPQAPIPCFPSATHIFAEEAGLLPRLRLPDLSADGRSGLTLLHHTGGHRLEPPYTCNACNAVLHRADTEFTRPSTA